MKKRDQTTKPTHLKSKIPMKYIKKEDSHKTGTHLPSALTFNVDCNIK